MGAAEHLAGAVGVGGVARRRVVALATVLVAALAAACTSPPPAPVDPAPPEIVQFFASPERAESPVVAPIGWTISDPNRDVLRCRVDLDGDGTFDREVVPCRSGDSLLLELTEPGLHEVTLEVDDGVFPAVSATTSIPVAAGPSESYEITLRIDPAMRPEFRDAFEAAAARWSEVIVAGAPDQYLDLSINPFGFPPFVGVVDDVLIDARDVALDGPGKVLGRAGAFAIRNGNFQPYYGIMEFDTADLDVLADAGRLHDVILHEMGHVLGMGASWLLTGKVVDFPLDPKYSGRAGIAAFQELGGARYVPLENEGGLGTVVGHWRESVFHNELMTGYLNAGEQPLSRLTVAALADLGYGVDLSAADPYQLPVAGAGAGAVARSSAPALHTEPVAVGIVGEPGDGDVATR